MQRRRFPIALALWMLGCSAPVTQIVLVVESDLHVPIEADRIEVRVLGPSGERVEASASLVGPDAPAAPYTLGLVPGGARLGPVHVRVAALRGSRVVVERVVRTEFVADRSITLVVRLERSCAPVLCTVDRTCAAGSCIDPFIPAGSLPIFGGLLSPPPDAGVACTGAPGDAELCDGTDQDCDGAIDEGFDVDVDPLHCGVCDHACEGGVACVRGTCGDPAVQIVAGEDHACALRASGRLACWGANEVGQLADDTRTDATRAVTIAGIEGATQIGIGERHTCALGRDGALRCWGWNAKGELGDGTTTDRDAPVSVPVDGVVELGIGYEHSCARTAGGEVWCWGSLTREESGVLVHEPDPFVVRGIVDPIAIEGGNESTCALEASGRLLCWGQGEGGRLGDGTTVDRGAPRGILPPEPVEVRAVGRFGFGFFAIPTGGAPWGWGRNQQAQLARLGIDSSARPLALVGVDGAMQIAGGREHGCALASDRVRCWGSDAHGQLGRGAILGGVHAAPEDVRGLPTGIVELACGGYFNCVRTASEIWCWGQNDRGQLADGTSADRAEPTRIVLPE